MAPENKLRLSNAMPTEPTFTLMFRGYNRREVDQYAHLCESQLAAAINERQELAARVQNLADQLAQAHTELVELRRRPGPNDKLNFRHLGPRVEQILAEAERQADAVRAAATDGVAQERERLQADLGRAREAHERAVREFEDGVHSRRAEEEKAIGKRLEAIRKEVADAQTHASRMRTEADLALATSQSESARVTATAQSAAEKMRSESAEQAKSIRTKAEQEAAAIAQAAESYARQTREEAEQQAHQTRAQAEQHAHQTIAGAEQTAKQLRLQAEEQAAQMRLAAEKHAARVYSGGLPFRIDAADTSGSAGATDNAGTATPDVAVPDGTGPDKPVPDTADGAQPRHRANVRAQPTG
jgi:cell division septum initiation protein DivIVA